jgi:hypothetical protein
LAADGLSHCSLPYHTHIHLLIADVEDAGIIIEAAIKSVEKTYEMVSVLLSYHPLSQ